MTTRSRWTERLNKLVTALRGGQAAGYERASALPWLWMGWKQASTRSATSRSSSDVRTSAAVVAMAVGGGEPDEPVPSPDDPLDEDAKFASLALSVASRFAFVEGGVQWTR